LAELIIMQRGILVHNDGYSAKSLSEKGLDLLEPVSHLQQIRWVFEAQSDAFNRSLVWLSAKPLKWYKLKPLLTYSDEKLSASFE